MLRSAVIAGIAGALCIACRSDHHVSPWPDDLAIDSLAAPPDLQKQLARIETETGLEHLVRVDEIKGSFSDRSPFVILSFAGEGTMQRQRTAVRVATGYGVVLALGPRDPADLKGATRSQLVGALAQGGGWKSGSDMNGDGNPDVVVRGEDGTLEVWYLTPKGASPYAVKTIAPPDHAVDVDDDGRPDLAARIRIAGDDPIGPSIVEVATFESGTYSHDTQAVRTWHKQQLERLKSAGESDGGKRATGDRTLLAEALESAWHAIRSGKPAAKALEGADAVAASRAPLGPGTSQAWVRWRGWLADVSG